MHGHMPENTFVKLGNLGKVYGLDRISKILASRVLCLGKFSDFEKLFRNSFMNLVDIYTPDIFTNIDSKLGLKIVHFPLNSLKTIFQIF